MEKRDILLVAGASGCGKSTFIEQLEAGTLNPGIRSALPEGCGEWPSVEANAVLRYGLSPAAVLEESGSGEGIILHYDIAFIHRHEVAGYAADPTMGFFEYAGNLHTVFIRPDLASLRRQFETRRERLLQKKGRFNLWWAKRVRMPLRALRAKLRGRELKQTVDLYREPGWLEERYREWEEFIRELVKERPGAKSLGIVPCEDGEGRPGFRVLSASEADKG